MTESVKAIIAKSQDTWTEEETTEVKDAIDAFRKAVDTVCLEHGMAYRAVIAYKPEGILPTLDIVPVTATEKVA